MFRVVLFLIERFDPMCEGSAFEQQAEYGGTRKSLGKYMFTNNIGEEIKKQVEDIMYKARCFDAPNLSASVNDLPLRDE